MCLAGAAFPSSRRAWGQDNHGKCGVAVLTSPIVLACCLKRCFPVYPKSSMLLGKRDLLKLLSRDAARRGWSQAAGLLHSGTCESVCLSVLSIFVCNYLHKADETRLCLSHTVVFLLWDSRL